MYKKEWYCTRAELLFCSVNIYCLFDVPVPVAIAVVVS